VFWRSLCAVQCSAGQHDAVDHHFGQWLVGYDRLRGSKALVLQATLFLFRRRQPKRGRSRRGRGSRRHSGRQAVGLWEQQAPVRQISERVMRVVRVVRGAGERLLVRWWF
jgi:hypothetical protein